MHSPAHFRTTGRPARARALRGVGLALSLVGAAWATDLVRPGAAQADVAPGAATRQWTDPTMPFKVIFPADWVPIQTESDGESGTLQPGTLEGYAIGFQSPQQGPDDRYADYLMIEILPGRDSGLFHTDGSQRQDVRVPAGPGVRDWLYLEDYRSGEHSIDLVVHQAELHGLGYTVGFYAIGEPDRDEELGAWFDTLLDSFRLLDAPWPTI